MTEEIKKWLNDKDFILAYRSNFDKANEVNEDLKNYVKQLQNEKQQLISFLEDKIKEYKQILNLYEKQNASLVEKARARNRISAYEEVIEYINNFVNKGGKDE